MAKRLIVLIDNDVEDLSALESAVKTVEPDSSCISFVFADEALQVVGQYLKQTPDFIFIDVNMARITGPECLIKLRTLEHLSECRIIMFSGVMPAAVGEAFKKLGASHYFQKPLGRSQYITTMSNILRTNVQNGVISS